MQLILDNRGMAMSVRNECFFLRQKTTQRMISPLRITSILVSSDCYLSTTAINLCGTFDIPLIIAIPGQEPMLLHSSHQNKNATLRKAQWQWSESTKATTQVIDWLYRKAQAQQHLLLFLSRQRGTPTEELRNAATQINTIQQQLKKHIDKVPNKCRMNLMGLEGSMAQIYWPAVGACLPPGLTFANRSRQPATDTFNAALNYSYALLQHRVEAAILSCRLDPFAGVLHVSNYGNTALVFDMMEPFRPWIDRCLINLALTNQLVAEMGNPVANGILLNKAGKRLLIETINQLMETKHKWENKITATKNHLLQEAAMVADTIAKNKF